MSELVRVLVREVKTNVGYEKPTTVVVGFRPDAVSDEECEHCWGTGRRLLYDRSWNCARGIHATCSGHQDPRRCGCYCHQAAAEAHGLLPAGPEEAR